MTTRHFSRLVIATTILGLTAALMFDGSTTSAAAGKGGSAPTAPTNLVVTAVTETTVSLSWKASTAKSSFSYTVRISKLGSSYNTLGTVSQTQTTRSEEHTSELQSRLHL